MKAIDSIVNKLNALPRWGLVAFGLLGLHVSAMMCAVRIATSDASFTSVPDYYSRAVDWDALQARRQASAGLDWTVEAAPSALRDRLVVTFNTQDGEPVDGLVGRIEAYQHLATKAVYVAELEPRGDGTYFATLDVSAVGAWQLAISARRGADECYFDERELVVANLEVAR